MSPKAVDVSEGSSRGEDVSKKTGRRKVTMPQIRIVTNQATPVRDLSDIASKEQDMSQMIRKFELRRMTEQLLQEQVVTDTVLAKNQSSLQTVVSPSLRGRNYSILNSSPHQS